MEVSRTTSDSLSDSRIEHYQDHARKATKLVKSPGGLTVARTFALDLGDEAPAIPLGDPQAEDAPIYYSHENRRRIVEQLRIVVEQFYVHAPMKTAQFGFDTARALDRLEPSIVDLSDADFHQAIVQIITRTRDRHLSFYGSSPYGVSAALPFFIDRCWEDEKEIYVVTKVRQDFTPQHLRVGARVSHWNGTPIERQIRQNANLFDGGNEPASLARSLEFLTQRPLTRFALPPESWVELRFEVDGQVHEERFDWEGFDVGLAPLTPAIGRNVIGFGGDMKILQSQATKRAQFAPQTFDDSPPQDPGAGDDVSPQYVGSTDNFQYGSVVTQHGSFGYIRLHHFGANDVDDIAHDMVTAFERMPRNGLIIDLRGNAGGYIAAGERLLQLLTPREIVPTRFQFRVTDGTRHMMSSTPYFERWKQSCEEAARTGESFSQGYPIEGTDADANQLGQRYFGPVVLITDALAFSTADMFVAGFIDHEIGRVICIDKNMAAAGGNNWSFDVLRLFLPDFRIDSSFTNELRANTLSSELRVLLHQNGLSLTSAASLFSSQEQYGGWTWEIKDGSLFHRIRHLPWISEVLYVYPANSRFGTRALPYNISFGFTARRCVRSGKSEGRLLEDLGIQPDVTYKPTLRDVLGQNHDLLTRAALEISDLGAHPADLRVETSQTADGSAVTCQTENMDSLEVFNGEVHYDSFDIEASGQVRFTAPASMDRLIIKGFARGKLVARRIVDLPIIASP